MANNGCQCYIEESFLGTIASEFAKHSEDSDHALNVSTQGRSRVSIALEIRLAVTTLPSILKAALLLFSLFNRPDGNELAKFMFIVESEMGILFNNRCMINGFKVDRES